MSRWTLLGQRGLQTLQEDKSEAFLSRREPTLGMQRLANDANAVF